MDVNIMKARMNKLLAAGLFNYVWPSVTSWHFKGSVTCLFE